MRDINEIRGAIPKIEFLLKAALLQGYKFLDDLQEIINDPDRNHKLYVLLEKITDKNKPHKTPFELNVYANMKIPIYLYLVYSNKRGFTSFGSVGAKRDHLFGKRKMKLSLALIGDPIHQLIKWNDSYREVMTHEITHVFQTLDVVLRALQMKKKEINTKSVEDMFSKVGSRGGSSSRLKGYEKDDELTKLNKQIAYQSTPAELGANANALLVYLNNTVGFDAIQEIVDYVDSGFPTFKDIDNAIKDVDRTGRTVWGTYENISRQEMQLKGIAREEWTKGYELKKLLLKTVSKFYKQVYNK